MTQVQQKIDKRGGEVDNCPKCGADSKSIYRDREVESCTNGALSRLACRMCGWNQYITLWTRPHTSLHFFS